LKNEGNVLKGAIVREVPRVIIVHGEKQNPDGSIHLEYVDRLKTAMILARDETVVLLTGGKTRREFQSEAAQAKDWMIQAMQVRQGLSLRILIEESSKTTAENIMAAQDVLEQEGIVPKEVMVLTRISAGPKTEHLYRKLWCLGKPEFEFVRGLDTKSIWYRLADRTILYLVAIIDPRDRWVLKIPKMVFRND
jgi:hypothetical protein